MKNFFLPQPRRWLVFASLLLVCLSTSAPVARADEARLIIHRAANFGTYAWLEIWIDGQKVEKGIALGHDFSTAISPGHHVIGLRRRPPSPYSQLNHVPLNVHSGGTYEFTAFWSNDRVVLGPSAGRNR